MHSRRRRPLQEIDLEGRPGVLGRADRFVETQPRFAPLARRLLGQTWIVQQLSHALELARSAGRGLNFVTLAGELLEADGTLVVGPRQAAAGLISRRSQFRALKTQLAELDDKVQQAKRPSSRATADRRQQEQQFSDARPSIARPWTLQANIARRSRAAEERRAQFDQQREVLDAELRAAETQHETAVRQLAEAREKRRQLDAGLSELEGSLAALGEQIGDLESQRLARSRETTETKVELAKGEERLRNLHTRLRQIEESRQERSRRLADGREQLAECLARAEASRRSILQAESEIAELYLAQRVVFRRNRRAHQPARVAGAQRTELTAERRNSRQGPQERENASMPRTWRPARSGTSATTLVERLREDYGIDLAAVEHEPADPNQEHEREAVQEEIDQLRQKINAIGSVNLESLDELQALEARDKTLSDQFQDLSAAKAALEKIIEQINTDSRRLFAETLETVAGIFSSCSATCSAAATATSCWRRASIFWKAAWRSPPGRRARNCAASRCSAAARRR